MIRSMFKAAAVIGLLGMAGSVAALDYVDIPVTIWDFHSDGSNPDFNPGVSFGSKDIVSGVTQYTCWNPLIRAFESTTAYTAGDGTPTLILHDPVLDQDIDTFTYSYPVETKELVASTLDADGLPQRGSNCSFSYEVNRWFKDWTSGNYQVPTYKKDVSGVHTPVETDGDGGFLAYATAATDTAFKNIRFEKTIRFLPRISTVAPFDTVWEYRNNNCYLLDGQGFGAEKGTKNWAYHSAEGTGDDAWVVAAFNAGEMRPTLNDPMGGTYYHNVRGGSTVSYYGDPTPHNYSYSMMLKRPFVYKADKNFFFSFRGDDDVWVFINGVRCIDIGGLHDPVEKTVALNDLARDARYGLVSGEAATLQFFFVERQADGSNCLISTNIVDGKPIEIKLAVSPSGTIVAGTTANVLISLPSDTGNVRGERKNVVVGTPYDSATNLPYIAADVRTDSTWSFTPTKAWVTVKVPFTYTREDGVPLSAVATWNVIAGDVKSIYVEDSPNRPADGTPGLWSKQEKAQVVLTQSETIDTNFYAIKRDQYGNWIGPDVGATWTTANSGIALASQGNATLGQGKATRVAPSGNTVFTVTDGTGLFTDNVDVVLSIVTYDSLRFEVNIKGTWTTITSLDLGIGKDTTVRVVGKNSLGTWEVVSAVITGGTLVSVYGDTVTGTTVGTGTLHSEFGGKTVDIPLVTGYGDPASVRLYTALGNPATVAAFGAGAQATAGVNLPIFAKVFDAAGNWIPTFEVDQNYSSQFRWNLQSGIGNSLTPNTSNATNFYSTKAWKNDTAVVSFNDGAGRTFTASLGIFVGPGEVKGLFIEGSADAPMNDSNGLGELAISSSATSASVYGILRDQFGNFHSYANGLSPIIENTGIATVANGDAAKGEMVVTRVAAAGDTKLSASVSVNGVVYSDDVPVSIKSYSYLELQFVTSSDANAVGITTLSLNTNQSQILYVKGMRSTDSLWEILSTVAYGKSLNLPLEIEPSTGVSFRVSPSDTAHGFITAFTSLGGLTDTLTVVFTPGPGVRMVLDLPDAAVAAGDTTAGTILVYNQDNRLVIGNTTGTLDLSFDPAGVAAALNAAGVEVVPFILGDLNNDGAFDVRVDFDASKNAHVPLWSFVNGRSTVKVVLFDVPDDFTYRFTGLIDSSLSAKDNLTIGAGDLSQLKLVDPANDDAPFGTTATVAWNRSMQIKANGYDAWGNLRSISGESSDWSGDASLPLIDNSASASTLFNVEFDPALSREGASGLIRAVSVNDPTKTDSLYLDVTAKAAMISTATTRDLDGNGYLDAIDVVFDQTVSLLLPTDTVAMKEFCDSILLRYTVAGTLVTIPVTRFSFLVGDNTIRLTLAEFVDTTLPVRGMQTSWTPLLTFGKTPTGLALVTDTLTKDGAGPVIVRVTKEIDVKNIDDRSSDKVTVYLSEGVQNADGIGLTADPENLLVVMRIVKNTTTGGFDTTISNIFSGVGTTQMVNDSVFTFTMDNDSDLTSKYFVRLRTLAEITGTLDIQDKSLTPNFPNNPNTAVRVTVINNRRDIIVGPNPFKPNTVSDGTKNTLTILYGDSLIVKSAQERVKNGGVLIRVFVDVHSVLSNVKAQLLITDAAGNLVAGKKCDAQAIELKAENGNAEIDFYWDGWSVPPNGDGRRAASGAYRLNIIVDVDGQTQNQAKTLAVRG